ncbi:MAG: hypothetical protein KIS68_12155 [Bauldia sp.]|nr:hypothetical protein [Bauldia sp.]
MAMLAPCAGCGLLVKDGTEGCQRLFETMVGRDFSDVRYGRIHGLVVDCYCLQHPDRYCISGKSFAAHLCGLCERIENGAGYAEHDERLRRWLDGPRKPEKPADLPSVRGAVTIADILAAADPDAHLVNAERWAHSIWEAYAPFHALARRWLAEAHAYLPARKRRR